MAEACERCGAAIDPTRGEHRVTYVGYARTDEGEMRVVERARGVSCRACGFVALRRED